MLADVAQVPMHHEVSRQHIGDFAGRGAALPPQPQCSTGDNRAHQPQHGQLCRAAPGVPHPRAGGAARPFVDDTTEPRILALFCAERLHHRVGTQRIRKRAAHAGVLRIRKPRRGRDHPHGQRYREAHVGDRTCCHQQSHHGPPVAKQHHSANQHHQRRQQGQQQHIVDHVQRPHAARDLAHGRSGEAVGMPVGGEALHAMESITRHIAHHPQRKRHDGPPGQMAQAEHGKPERRHHREGAHGFRHGIAPLRHCVDQAACVQRHGHFRQRGERHGCGHTARKQTLPPPVGKREGKNFLQGCSAPVGNNGH